MDGSTLHEHAVAASDRTAGELLRVVLGSVRRLPATVAPTGFAAVAHRDLVAAGLDPSVVANWVHAVQGFEGVTYLRPAQHALWHEANRPPLQPVPYVAIPRGALESPAA